MKKVLDMDLEVWDGKTWEVEGGDRENWWRDS
jgi:hypothetical protein